MSLCWCFSLFRHHISPTCLLSSTTAAQQCNGWAGLSWNPSGERNGGDRAGYSKCGGNVSPRREELKTNEPQNIKPSRRKDYFFLAHTKGLLFSRRHERAVRSYQTPSSRVDAGPFSCLIYSDKSFRGNGL